MFGKLNINDFDYHLPKEKIAYYPAKNRTHSKLLVFDKDKIIHSIFDNISNFISPGSLLIVNSTKVLPARILLKKDTGGVVEFLLLEPYNMDISTSLNSKVTTDWNCIVGGRNIRVGRMFTVIRDNVIITIEILKRHDNRAVIRFHWKNEEVSHTADVLTFAEILEKVGQVPLPPYIKRVITDKDISDYQTIYANNLGSVASPTAGLHWTSDILDGLKNSGVKISELNLHIGMGTFVPISGSIKDHKMHSEKLLIHKETIANLLLQYHNNTPVIATGTTSLRTLESLYWFAIQIIKNKINNTRYNENSGFYISQGEIYENKYDIDLVEIFNVLLDFMDKKSLKYLQGSTEIFIVPGYNIKTIDGLITNFHLPKSTLMLLVSAFVGTENIKNIYKEALENNYRFLSYGDSSLLLR